MKWLGRIGFLLANLAIGGLAFGQTATLLPDGIQQYFDNNGKPVANGSVGYYVPNTTTPKTTWTSSNESGPVQPNPVPLGIAGRPSSPIYGDGAYRQIVKDQFNNTIWDFTTASTGGGSGTSPAWSEGVMVGTIIPWANTALPAKYLYTAGQAISRTTYPDLLVALTFTTNILCSSGIATITVSTTISEKMPIGAPIESSCFVPGTTVIAKSSGQLTMSTSATVTISTSAQLFPWGNGDGATTFNVPDLRGRTLVGRDNMNNSIAGILTSTYYSSNPDAVGAKGGNQTNALTTANTPPYTPSGSVASSLVNGGSTLYGFIVPGTNVGFGGGATGGSQTQVTTQLSVTSTFTGTLGGGTSAPFSIIPPALTSDYIIKALADDMPAGPGVTSIQGMTGPILCGGNVVCTGNTISVTISPGVLSLGGMSGNIACGTNVTCAAGTISVSNPYTVYITPASYGALCDGVTNDTAALQNMLNAASGKTILFPAATCVINAHLNVPANTTITGLGRNVSIIKQTGADYIFGLANVSNVSISDLWLLGTDSYISWSVSNVGAISINATAVNITNNTFRNLRLSGFNANYWINGTQSGSSVISNTTFDNLLLNTTTADVPTDGVATNNSNFGISLFSASGGSRWENTTIQNTTVDGSAICIHIVQWSDHYKYKIINNRLLSPGNPNTNSHCTNGLGATNAYGIAVYDAINDGNPASNGMVSQNYILNPNASGIYYVGDGTSFLRANNSNQATISNNFIEGQNSSDSLLPRAAISISLSTDISVIGNTLYNNQNCVYLSGQSAGNIGVYSNHCSTGAGASSGIIMTAGANGSSNTDRRSVRGNYFDAVTAITGLSSTGARFNFLDISGNTIVGATTTVGFGSPFIIGSASFVGNYFSGAGTANFASATGSLYLQDNGGLSFTAAGLPTAANGSSVFVSDGAPASSPCTGTSTGSMAFRQNAAWKCF